MPLLVVPPFAGAFLPALAAAFTASTILPRSAPCRAGPAPLALEPPAAPPAALAPPPPAPPCTTIGVLPDAPRGCRSRSRLISATRASSFFTAPSSFTGAGVCTFCCCALDLLLAVSWRGRRASARALRALASSSSVRSRACRVLYSVAFPCWIWFPRAAMRSAAALI